MVIWLELDALLTVLSFIYPIAVFLLQSLTVSIYNKASL